MGIADTLDNKYRFFFGNVFASWRWNIRNKLCYAKNAGTIFLLALQFYRYRTQ
jgi:hypothetical protein